MEKEQFIRLIEAKTGKQFLNNELFDACIDETIELYQNSKLKDPKRFSDDPEQIFQSLLKMFLTDARMILKLNPEGPIKNIRKVSLQPFYLQKETLLNQLETLNYLLK